MRRFTLGSAADRKIVVLELNGTRMSVTKMTPDGSTKRTEKDLGSEAGARAASEQVARELIARGYTEHNGRSASAQPARSSAAVAKPVARARELDAVQSNHLFDDVEAPVATAAPVLPRLDAAPSAEPAAESVPKKKKKTGGKKKKKKAGGGDDALDKRVLAGIAGVGALLVGMIGYVVYDSVLKPPTIVGTWRGSLLEHEVSRLLRHTKYDLLLDEHKRAALTLQEKYTSVGTYSVKGDLLTLNLKDEEGDSSERQYRFVLGRATLDLKDPQSGELSVQLIRFLDKPVIRGEAPPAEAPKELAAGEVNKIDTAADERLASVEFSPKDGAFKIRYPKGWQSDTGSRPDNTYSWATFSHDPATIKIYADIKGSLMSGSDSAGQHEEGSESAPVHIAHELYKKTAAEELSDYKESKPVVFKGSTLGEGRLSVFTASEGGMFGSQLRGYHVTLLTRDRRVSILCQCPVKEFPKLKPTFLAVCRSLSR